MEAIVSKEVATLIAAFKGNINDFLRGAKDEIIYRLEMGLTDYLESRWAKYIHTKNFLHRNDPVYFYDIYFPVSLTNKNGKVRIDDNTDDLFYHSRYVSIIGIAGSGKTTVTKHIFLECIKTKKKIPVIIDLRDLNDFSGGLEEYISSVVLNNRIAPNENILNRIFVEGILLFILDGYDELYSARKTKVTTEITSFVDIYYRNLFVITSRPGVDLEGLDRFYNHQVNPLDSSEITRFINLQLSNDLPLASRIIASIEKSENFSYREYLSNPLLLSMFILTYNNYPDLPKYKNKFYWNVFDTLVTKHDSVSKRGGWQHERKSKLPNDVIEQILKWFSYISFFESAFSFDRQYLQGTITKIKATLQLDFNVDNLIEDLVSSISILIIEGLEYKFPHRSLQEYFTASLISGLGEQEKKDIYENKFNSVFSESEIENFYGLCEELDKKSFYTFYLFPKIERILTEITAYDPHSSFIKVVTYFRLSQGVILNDSSTFSRESFSYTHLLSLNIFKFIKFNFPLFDMLTLSGKSAEETRTFIDSFSKNPHVEEIDQKDGKKRYLIPPNGLIHMINILKDMDVVNDIYDKVVALRLHFNMMKSSLNREQSNQSSLLNVQYKPYLD